MNSNVNRDAIEVARKVSVIYQVKSKLSKDDEKRLMKENPNAVITNKLFSSYLRL